MSQDAGAGDSKQSKRSQNPAYVYGPMVYQFPPDSPSEGGKEKPKSNQGNNFLVLLMIITLAVGGVILYLRENGVDIRQLNPRRDVWGSQTYRDYNENGLRSQGITHARVAVDSLYMREGPGMEHTAIYLLPEDWRVSLLGDCHTDNYGEVWARILVETEQGTQEGWVSRKYLQF